MPALPVAEDWVDKTPWIRHRPGLDRKLAAEGHTVFVNYTATWCTECQIQKKTVLGIQAIREQMRELGVVPLQADWTRKRTWITEELERYGRPGAPLNVIIPAGKPDEPIILSLHISKAEIEEKLNEAGPSKSKATPTMAQAGLTP